MRPSMTSQNVDKSAGRPFGTDDEELKIVQDATCTFCGCVCDDIELHVRSDRIVKAKRACVLGGSWFRSHEIEDRPSCVIEGQAARVEDGVERAADLELDQEIMERLDVIFNINQGRPLQPGPAPKAYAW